MNLKEISLRRRTVKKYNPEKGISAEELKQILDFVYQSPTSMNWQATRVVVVKRNSEIFKKFNEKTNGFNWSKVKDAQATLYFISPRKEMINDLSIKRGMKNIELIENRKGTNEEALKSQEGAVNFINNYIDGGFDSWAARQSYIAMSFAAIAAANLNIDSTIQEGIMEDEIKKVFIEEKLMINDEQIVLALSLGHRSDEDGAVLKTYRDQYEEKIKIAK